MHDKPTNTERNRTVKDCFQCRVIGVGTFSGIAGDALYLRQFKTPTTDKSQKLFLAAFAVGATGIAFLRAVY